MTSRTASLRLQLIDAVSGPSKSAAGSLKGLDATISKLGKGASPEVQRLVKQLDHLRKKSGAIENFADTRRGLKDVGLALKGARGELTRVEAALKATATPTKKLQQDLLRAKSAVKGATDAFNMQKQSVSAAERVIRSFSVSSAQNLTNSQKQIRSQVAQTIREIRRLKQEEEKKPPRNPRDGVTRGLGSTILGGYAAYEGKNLAQRSFFEAVEFNRVAAYQAALGDLGDEDRAKLNRQAEKIGGDTRFSNADVVTAQTTVLQRGIRDTQTIMDLTKNVTDYALAMGVTLEEAADTVTGSALSKRIDLKDTKAIGNFVDFMVWMAKNGGMSDEDVRQFVKYGGAPTTGAKLPDEYMAAMGMILRRSNVRGDEAGVFARAAASKLVAPTKKGRDALTSMGIDYNAFTAIDSMNADGVGIMMKNNFGVRLTDEMKAAVKDLIDNGEFMDPETGLNRSVISDSGEFVTQMSDILGPLFADRKGNVAAADAKALAKALADYQKYSVDSVDATGLLNAIAASNPTLGNLNAFFTDKQGGRANMIFQQWPLFQEMLQKMQNTPSGVANKIGTEANAELFGDWTKLVGTFETTLTRVGQDFEEVTRPLINFTNGVLDGFLQLDKTTRQLIVAFGAAAVTFGAFAAGKGLLGLLGGGLRGGGAAAGAGGGLAGLFGGGKGIMRSLGRGLGLYSAWSLINDIPSDPKELEKFMAENKARWDGRNKWLEDKIGSPASWVGRPGGASSHPGVYGALAMENARGARSIGLGGTTDTIPGKTADDLASPYSAGGGGKGNSMEVNAPVDAPINVQLNGVMLPEVLAIVRQTATQTVNETMGKLQAALSQQLHTTSRNTVGAVKPYGD